MFRFIKFWITVICIWGVTGTVSVCAQEAEYQNSSVEAEGFDYSSNISDGNSDTYARCKQNASVIVSNDSGIASVYVEFDRIPQTWTLTDSSTGISVSCGTNSFLHEYVDIIEAFNGQPKELVMEFAAGTSVADIYVFTDGTIPDWVQIWEPPCEEADLLLISSHSDDEQLFFSGILPYYAGERGLNVQVVYIVQHFEANGVENHQRPHEQLNGLWTVGVRNYPVMSDFPDLYAESKDYQTAFDQASAVFATVGITYDDFISYITECIRRFKPLVVVSHDLNGEYGHGTHVLCATALTEAIGYAQDAEKYPESAQEYGIWTVEKTYLHLYEENQIVMDFDVPLNAFGGKTAFEVSQDGFACHKSQHWTWFYKWMYGTEENPIKKAADIRNYSPCYYGLYDSKKGPDKVGGDFFENVQTYEERKLAQLKAEEEEKKLAEEAALKEAEEQARQEQERLEQERLKQEAEIALQMKEEKENVMLLVWIGIIACITVVGIVFLVVRKKNRLNKR